MSTRSRSASAPKAEQPWTPERTAAWLETQAQVQPDQVLYQPGVLARGHAQLAGALLTLTPDRTPLPLTPDEVPMLP